jgi:hypothetical protein
MRKSLAFLAFFCAIVVIDGNFIHDIFRRRADLGTELQQQQPQPPVQGGQQNQQTGSTQDQQDQDQDQDQQGQDQDQDQDQQDQQQFQGLGQGKEAIDCFKFNTESHLSNDEDCLRSTTILRNDTHLVFCDSTLASQGGAQGNSSQGNSSQGSVSSGVRPIMSCKVDEKGILTCFPKDQGMGGGMSGGMGANKTITTTISTSSSSTTQNTTQVQPQGSSVQGNSSQGGMSGSQGLTDILGKTFTGCFFYKLDELNQPPLPSEDTFEDDIIEWTCVKRKPNQMTMGIVGEQEKK